MKNAARLLACVVAVAVALGGGVAYAEEHESRHPSGKDRTHEPGGSGPQGASPSEPDDDGRGPERDASPDDPSNDDDGRGDAGSDKPGGQGGVYAGFDTDANNGCGNDHDFDDDNEGWCGKPTEAGADADDSGAENEVAGEDEVTGGSEAGDQSAVTAGTATPTTTSTTTPTTMPAGQVAAAGASVAPAAEVLGVAYTGPHAPAAVPAADVRALGADRRPLALARTGFGLVTLVAFGLGLVVLGALVAGRRRAA